jgi:hypothetical protein
VTLLDSRDPPFDTWGEVEVLGTPSVSVFDFRKIVLAKNLVISELIKSFLYAKMFFFLKVCHKHL